MLGFGGGSAGAGAKHSFNLRGLFRSAALFPAAVCLGASFASPSYAADKAPAALEIISLLEDKKYDAAAGRLEKEIRRSRNQSQKGHYALLLSQIPLNVKTARPRHEYAFLAAGSAEGIPQKKRMQLWIEAADGFFKTGHLRQAEGSYKKAFLLAKAEGAKSEAAYILYKRAWTWVNQKDLVKAFHFLIEAEKEKESRLRENILFDAARIWAESQYFEKKAPLSALSKVFQSLRTPAEKKPVFEGLARGITRKKNVRKALSALSRDEELFSETVNYVLTAGISLAPGQCGMIPYIEKSIPAKLDREKSLSALNSCSRALIAQKRRSRGKKKYLKRLSRLYLSFERRGAERYPLALIHEYLGQKNSACEESLRQLAETVSGLGSDLSRKKTAAGKSRPAGQKAKKKPSGPEPPKKTAGEKLRESMGEAFRLCERAKKPDRQLVAAAAERLLFSKELRKAYTSADGSWENIFFHILDSRRFFFRGKAASFKAAQKMGEKRPSLHAVFVAYQKISGRRHPRFFKPLQPPAGRVLLYRHPA